MAEKLSDPHAGEDTAVGPDRQAAPATSGWQKVVGILGLVVVVWVGSELYDVVLSTAPVPAPPTTHRR